MNDKDGSGSRLAGAARSCGRYLWTGLIMIGQTGMFYWYPPHPGTVEQFGASVPSQAYVPMGTVPPVPHFAGR